MRVLFDTNVLFAAFTVSGFCRELVEEASPLYTLVWSPVLRTELTDALRKKRLISERIIRALDAFANLCEMHPPRVLSKPICRDRDDDIVLGVALAGRAGVIVTGDEDLLVLKKFEGIRILSPRTFLELLHSKG